MAVAALLATASMHLRCTSTASNDGSAAVFGAAGGTTATNTVSPSVSSSLAFDSKQMSVSVLSQNTVSVHVSPAQGQTVTFAFLGESLDASLQAAQVPADESGLASVTLTAPGQSTTFTIRASLDRDTIAELRVEVTSATTGSIDVSTKYAGTRQIETYAIQVFANEDCASAAQNAAPKDRNLVTTSSMPVHIENLPIGTPLSVVIDGDQTTHGCAALRSISSAASVSVVVPLEDLPLSLQGQSLDVAMTATNGMALLEDSLRAIVPTLIGAFVVGDHDLTDLLVEMETIAVGSLQQEFSSLRKSNNWDGLVVSTYASVGGSDLLRRQLRDWLSRGIALLSHQPNLEVRLNLGPADFSTPQLSLVRIAGLDAAAHLSVQSSNLAVNIESGDRFSWSSTLSFNQADLVEALAVATASVDYPTGVDIPSQLALRLSCDAFVDTLDQNALLPNATSRVCGTTCLGTLCRQALNAMYKRTKAAAFSPPTTPLFINASGVVTVSGTAKPTATTGSWVGVWSSENSAVTLTGTCASK